MSERILETIDSPADLKALDQAQLLRLAAEIRHTIIHTVARTGGHLAPNLGVVELTLGLHRALDVPRDRIVWDVGHQSYVHKLVSGRRERFDTLRQFGGVCGFPKKGESECDVFDTGHASNSISVALGMAEARDARGGDETVVAVIGDGSLTGGMAFEALNHAGHLGTRVIVVLNDNEMSIAANVGALAGYLARVRLDPRYQRLRDDVESRLARIPGVGRAMVTGGEMTKQAVKQLLVPGMLFEELGFKYVGPIDGHDVEQVQKAVAMAKQAVGPVLIHAVTRKGAGYVHAEEMPDAYHGVAPFEVSTGKQNGHSEILSYTDVFGRALVREAAGDDRICAITAAMPSGTGLDRFAEAYPDRFYDVGIAEQHAVGMAAGLACGGRLPVVAIYSTFMQRAYDQLVMDVALQDLHVVFCLDRAGLVGEDGPTHHGVFDLTYLRSIPNLTVLAPSNGEELVHSLHTALQAGGPVAIRYPRGKSGISALPVPVVLERGRSEVRRAGGDVTMLAVGRMVGVAERAADLLAEAGVAAGVVDMRWVKPLDVEAVRRAAAGRLVVTIEENTGQGGFGAAVMETLASYALAPAVLQLAIPDEFVTFGATECLLDGIGLTPEGVRDSVLGRLADASGEGLGDDTTQGRRNAR